MALSDQLESRQPVRLPTFKGRGLQPGVDLHDSAALLALMERTEREPTAPELKGGR